MEVRRAGEGTSTEVPGAASLPGPALACRPMSEARSSWRFAPGDEVDPSLVVLEALGGGRRYEVVRAWDRQLFCDVVVKLLRPTSVSDERSRAGFERELRIASRLAHPNLVRLLRARSDGERPYLVLELVTAPSLADHLEEQGAVGLPEVCLLGIRVLAALHHLHANGVVHLDVKPENVTTGDPPRLLDLSLARPYPAILEHPVGTTAYMAPEQCRAAEVTPRTDLFGLGVTLYESLSGVSPFSDGDSESRDLGSRYPQLVESPQPLRELVPAAPRELAEVIHACIAPDPRDRPSGATEMAVVLERVLEDLGLEQLLAWPRGLGVTQSKSQGSFLPGAT